MQFCVALFFWMNKWGVRLLSSIHILRLANLCTLENLRQKIKATNEKQFLSTISSTNYSFNRYITVETKKDDRTFLKSFRDCLLHSCLICAFDPNKNYDLSVYIDKCSWYEGCYSCVTESMTTTNVLCKNLKDGMIRIVPQRPSWHKVWDVFLYSYRHLIADLVPCLQDFIQE